MRHRRVFDPAGVFFGIVVPLLAAAIGLLLTRLWRSRLPAEIATDWSSSTPDGFTEPTSAAWVFALAIVLVGGGCGGVAALAQAMLLMRRLMLLVGTTVIGLLLTLQVSMLWIQLDQNSPTDAQLPWPIVGLGVIAGLLFGCVGAAMLRDFRERPTATEPPAAKLPRGATVPIVDVAGFSRLGSAVFAGVILSAGGLGCLAIDSTWPLIATVPVAIVVLALLRFEVLVDESGVRVRNFGLTSLDIGIDEVTGAKVVEVSPFKDFGGWGLRTQGHRRYGIVTQTGPAVEVSTESGMTLTITTPRAALMAGALNSWADARAGD